MVRMVVLASCLLMPVVALAQEPSGTSPPASAPPAAAAPDPSGARPLASDHYDIIRMTDGRVLTGKILRETAAGYLFRSSEGVTQVVEFGQIADLQSTAPRAVEPGPGKTTPDAKGDPAAKAAPALAADTGVSARLRSIDEEIKELSFSRRSQVNAGLSLGGGLLFITVGAVGLACCVDNNPSVKTTSVVSLVSGGVLAVVGGIMLGVNASHNGDVELETRRLESEKRRLSSEAALDSEGRLLLPVFGYSAAF